MRGRTAVLLLALALCGSAVRASESTGGLDNAVQGLLSNILTNIKAPVSTFTSAAGGVKETLLQQYATLSKQLEEQRILYEDSFCTPGVFVPGSKQPATFVGHSFAVTFDTGSCYFNDTAYAWEGAKELNCTEPSVSFVVSPANFTSAYHKAATFTSKFCQLSKSFGEPSEVVLKVFDGSEQANQLDLQDLSAKIGTELQTMLSSFGSGLKGPEGGLLGGGGKDSGMLGGLLSGLNMS